MPPRLTPVEPGLHDPTHPEATVDATLIPVLAVEAGGDGAASLHVGSLLAVLVAAWILGRIANRLGYPSVLGELLGGILLGPPMLGLLSADAAILIIGELGILLMMLYIGIEIDVRDLRKASRPGLLAAVGGFIVPFALGFGLIVATGGTVIAGLFVGSAVGVTSLATKSRILLDLELLDTRIAYVLMAGAVLSDTATLLVFAGILAFVEAGGFDPGATLGVATSAAAFFAVAIGLGVWALPRIAQRLPQGADQRTPALVLILAWGLGLSWFAELAGLHAILGAFVAGLFLRDDSFGGRAAREATHVLKDVSLTFLAPAFFISAGFQADLGVFQTDLPLLIGVLVVSFVGKIGGTLLFYLPTGHGWREGLVVGAAMNGRGAVEIVVAGLGLELGLIGIELFTILVFMAIFTTATVPILLTAGVRWLRGRDELESSSDKRRKVVLCGAGAINRLLATELGDARPVILVDANADLCAAARRAGLSVIRGDVLDPEVLRRIEMTEVGTFGSLTANSEVNTLAVQLAREEFFVPITIAAIRDDAGGSVERLQDRYGARAAFGGHVDVRLWERWLEDGKATTEVIPISDEIDAERIRGTWTERRRGLPLVVQRGDDRHLFDAVDEVRAGDRVVVLTRTETLAEEASADLADQTA